jgi:MFS family permease
MPLRRPDRDAILVCVSAFIRSLTVALVVVVLAIYLAQLGWSAVAIGAVVSAGLAGGALATLLIGFYGDGFGRRRSLVALGLVTAFGYASVAVTDQALILVPLAFVGMLNGMGRDRGAAAALEQAILPATGRDEQRTWVLAWYNVVLDAGHAVGALAGTVPTLLMRLLSTDVIRAHRLTFWLCGVAMVGSLVPCVLLSQRVEGARSASNHARMTPDSQRAVRRLTLLFGIDSLGGGFLSSTLIAYWFFQRFGTSEATLAGLFFAARMLNAAGHVTAAWVARRIGLVNTMVMTHLPSSLFMMAAPLAPTATMAIVLFLCREALVEMDVPTRQSYVMAIVRPSERTAASGITNVTRNVGWAVGPSIAGFVMQHTLAGPLLIGGALKVGYDVLLYASFRQIKPPEEERSQR